MATGRNLQLTKQTGEYLVAAELCRRGLIATTFTGSVPHYDIVASDESGNHVSVQVKAIASRSPSWQFDASRFIEISMDGKRQVLGRLVPTPLPNLICVFVKLSEYGSDQFYVFSWEDLRDTVVERHSEHLKKHNYVRPRKPDSFHVSVSPDHLQRFAGLWETIEQALRTAP